MASGEARFYGAVEPATNSPGPPAIAPLCREPQSRILFASPEGS